MPKTNWSILLVLMMVETVAALESGMVIAGIPRWVQLHGDPVKVGWLISAYLVVQAAAAVLGGRLGDMFGRRRAIIVCLALCVIGSLISGLSSSLDWMIAGRAVQGAAGALQALCYGVIRETMPKERMRFGISVILATAAGAAAFGMVAGGYLTDHLGPQTIFLAMAITGVVALTLVVARLPRGAAAGMPERFDVLGGVLFVPGMVLLLLGVSSMEKGELTSGGGLGLLGGGVALLAVWALYELRLKEPLIDVRLLGNRDIALANTVMGLMAASLMQTPLAISMLIQQPTWTEVGLGGSATLVGWLTFPSLIAATLGSLATGRIADRVGPRIPMMAGCLLACGSLVLAMISHDSIVMLAIILILSSVGLIAAFSSVPMVVAAIAPADRVSEATGFIGVIRGLFRAVGMQLMAVLLMSSTISMPGQKPMPDETGFMIVLGGMAAAAFLAFVAAFCIRGTAGTDQAIMAPARTDRDSSPRRGGETQAAANG